MKRFITGMLICSGLPAGVSYLVLCADHKLQIIPNFISSNFIADF
jgi:hypothetical protein